MIFNAIQQSIHKFLSVHPFQDGNGRLSRLLSTLPGIKSGVIAEKRSIPNPTVKRILSELVEKGLIEKFGSGRSTNYAIK
jgi:Fic family protein